jgi:hypothetical protein
VESDESKTLEGRIVGVNHCHRSEKDTHHQILEYESVYPEKERRNQIC